MHTSVHEPPATLLTMQLQEKLGEDIQIEKFRMDLESSQTLVR